MPFRPKSKFQPRRLPTTTKINPNWIFRAVGSKECSQRPKDKTYHKNKSSQGTRSTTKTTTKTHSKIERSSRSTSSLHFLNAISTGFRVKFQSLYWSRSVFFCIFIDRILLLYYVLPGITIYLILEFTNWRLCNLGCFLWIISNSTMWTTEFLAWTLTHVVYNRILLLIPSTDFIIGDTSPCQTGQACQNRCLPQQSYGDAYCIMRSKNKIFTNRILQGWGYSRWRYLWYYNSVYNRIHWQKLCWIQWETQQIFNQRGQAGSDCNKIEFSPSMSFLQECISPFLSGVKNKFSDQLLSAFLAYCYQYHPLFLSGLIHPNFY